MDLRRLKHLVTLADARNFGRAALLCHVSQSAFSRSVQAAEEELGLKLFDRGTLEVTCTDAGAFVVERARKLLQKVGLAGYEDKFPWQLSGGMQQRASICRALIHEPKMLLLDEPFGALDAFTREELWCILRDLWTEQQFNVILVTHDLRESVFLADTVYVMSKSPGRFVVKKEIELPRPRDLEVTYTKEFTDIVHELRGHIGALRKAGAPIQQ